MFVHAHTHMHFTIAALSLGIGPGARHHLVPTSCFIVFQKIFYLFFPSPNYNQDPSEP